MLTSISSSFPSTFTLLLKVIFIQMSLFVISRYFSLVLEQSSDKVDEVDHLANMQYSNSLGILSIP